MTDFSSFVKSSRNYSKQQPDSFQRDHPATGKYIDEQKSIEKEIK